MKNSFNTIWYYDKRGLPTHNSKKGIMMHYGFEDGSFVLIPKNADGTYPDPPDKMPTEEDDTEDDDSEVSATGWSEDDHPRGQPENSGQFVKKGEGRATPKLERVDDPKLGPDPIALPDSPKETTIEDLQNKIPLLFDRQRYKVDVRGLDFVPELNDDEIYGLRIKAQNIADVLNDVPDQHVKIIKSVTLRYNPDSKVNGSWSPRTQNLTFNIGRNNLLYSHVVRRLTWHEIAHSKFDEWPREKRERWAKAVENSRPLNAYAKSYIKVTKQWRKDEQNKTDDSTSILLERDNEVDRMEFYLKRGGTDERDTERLISDYMAAWGVTKEQIVDGTLRSKLEDQIFEMTHRYANEQHSALLEVIWGHPGAKKEGFDKKGFKELLAIWRNGRFGTNE